MKRLSETLKELGIEFTFPIQIRNSKGNETYFEDSDGYWCKREYDSDGNVTYFEDSNNIWCKKEYDSKGNVTYFEGSDGIKRGTKRSSCEGKVIEIDGIKYELKLK